MALIHNFDHPVVSRGIQDTLTRILRATTARRMNMSISDTTHTLINRDSMIRASGRNHSAFVYSWYSSLAINTEQILVNNDDIVIEMYMSEPFKMSYVFDRASKAWSVHCVYQGNTYVKAIPTACDEMLNAFVEDTYNNTAPADNTFPVAIFEMRDNKGLVFND